MNPRRYDVIYNNDEVLQKPEPLSPIGILWERERDTFAEGGHVYHGDNLKEALATLEKFLLSDDCPQDGVDIKMWYH